MHIFIFNIKSYNLISWYFTFSFRPITEKIKQIKVKPDFIFTSQKNVALAGIFPLAKSYMDNLQDIDERINNLFLSNPKIYILNNSIFLEIIINSIYLV